MKYSFPTKPPKLMYLDGRKPIPYNCSPAKAPPQPPTRYKALRKER